MGYQFFIQSQGRFQELFKLVGGGCVWITCRHYANNYQITLSFTVSLYFYLETHVDLYTVMYDYILSHCMKLWPDVWQQVPGELLSVETYAPKPPDMKIIIRNIKASSLMMLINSGHFPLLIISYIISSQFPLIWWCVQWFGARRVLLNVKDDDSIHGFAIDRELLENSDKWKLSFSSTFYHSQTHEKCQNL